MTTSYHSIILRTLFSALFYQSEPPADLADLVWVILIKGAVLIRSLTQPVAFMAEVHLVFLRVISPVVGFLSRHQQPQQGKFVLQTIHCNNATLWLSLVFCASVRNKKQDTSFNQQVTMDTQMKGPLFIALLGLEQIYRASTHVLTKRTHLSMMAFKFTFGFDHVYLRTCHN